MFKVFIFERRQLSSIVFRASLSLDERFRITHRLRRTRRWSNTTINAVGNIKVAFFLSTTCAKSTTMDVQALTLKSHRPENKSKESAKQTWRRLLRQWSKQNCRRCFSWYTITLTLLLPLSLLLPTLSSSSAPIAIGASRSVTKP